mmetsp:Transcript_57582/g.187063  ORF Transcript_57582/g.187063 Transcript_57582/m.187063 type:complete len:171 (-) Transcript_57582:176-688(-)
MAVVHQHLSKGRVLSDMSFRSEGLSTCASLSDFSTSIKDFGELGSSDVSDQDTTPPALSTILFDAADLEAGELFEKPLPSLRECAGLAGGGATGGTQHPQTFGLLGFFARLVRLQSDLLGPSAGSQDMAAAQPRRRHRRAAANVEEAARPLHRVRCSGNLVGLAEDATGR